MSYSAKITSKGQITLPAELRSALGLKEGDRVLFEQVGTDEYRIRSIGERSSLKGILKPFLKRKTPLTTEEMDQAIAEECSDRQRRR